MNRLKKIQDIRKSLRTGGRTIGSWMQIPHPTIAEILGQAGYDWIAVDLEHGAISPHQLPDIFRALELGSTLPLARLAQGLPKDCKQALDAGAGGVIVPMVKSAEQLETIRDACRWPPVGNRGVAFSRANLFGKYFDKYVEEAHQPLLIAMIEQIEAVNNLEEIIRVEGLDALLIGPYDLSASMGMTAKFEHDEFKAVMKQIIQLCHKKSFPAGIHIVQPSSEELHERCVEGYQFIAFSMDSVFLTTGASIQQELLLNNE